MILQLDPKTYLEHGDKVNIILVNHLIHELDKLFYEALVLLQPGCVEMKTKRSTVGGIMTVKVVSQHASKLIW